MKRCKHHWSWLARVDTTVFPREIFWCSLCGVVKETGERTIYRWPKSQRRKEEKR